MRILVLVTDAFGGYGGIAQFNRDFLTALCLHSDCQEVVVIPRVMPYASESCPSKLRYVTEGLNSKWKYLVAVFKTVLKNPDFDIIICGHIHLLVLSFLVRSIFVRCAPLVLLLYGIEAWRPRNKMLINWIAEKIDAFISVSEITKSRFLQWVKIKQEIFILPPCVDLNRFTLGPKNEALINFYGLKGKTVIMTLGRIDSRDRFKGFEETMELIPLLKNKISNLAYLIVGDGQGRRKLERKAKKIGIDGDVIFTGYIKESEKMDHYRLADSYVMPSQGEGFGIVFLEAMACGVPVVASKLDGGREALRNGELGQLVDPRNSEEIKEAILQSLKRAKSIPNGLNYFSCQNFQRRTHEIIQSTLLADLTSKENIGKRYRLAVLNSHPIQYFAPLYREIAKSEDIDLTVFYCSRQGLKKGFRDEGFGREVVWDTPLLDGYQYRFLKNLWGDKGRGGFFSLVNFGIIQHLWNGKYDAVLIHGQAFFTYVLTIFFAKLFGIKILFRTDTNQVLEKRKKGFKKLLKNIFLPRLYSLFDAFLYIGERNRQFYESMGVSKEKLFFSPFSVDNKFFTNASNRARCNVDLLKENLSMPSDMPVILFVSKFIASKRPADLLEAYKILYQKGIKAALLMIGDGPESKDLERCVIQNHLPNVHFLGFKNQSELPSYYAAADVFVLPAQNEQWGLVINEAMCAGVPVIATSEVGAADDLIRNGVTGFIYEKGDVQALAAFLERILTDKELQMQMNGHCLKRIDGWSHSNTIAGFRQALQNRINKKSRRILEIKIPKIMSK